LRGRSKTSNFEQAVLPHLNAAYNLARWLTRSDSDAEDVVQEACLRAFTFFEGYHGGDSRAWLLKIVRNTGYTWLQQNRARELMAPLEDALEGLASEAGNPEPLLLQRIDAQPLRQALEELPPEFREVMVLRELEGLAYKEIADIAQIPIGTVMSRLARARKRLQERLGGPRGKEL
jgi:RNA polymerase sigma factor (sigma-70 family)